jgi:uncharacterized integral membrane protein
MIHRANRYPSVNVHNKRGPARWVGVKRQGKNWESLKLILILILILISITVGCSAGYFGTSFGRRGTRTAGPNNE